MLFQLNHTVFQGFPCHLNELRQNYIWPLTVKWNYFWLQEEWWCSSMYCRLFILQYLPEMESEIIGLISFLGLPIII